MEKISGQIERITTYEEASPTDWFLAISKILWFVMWILVPLTLYRFLSDSFGTFYAVAGLFSFLLILKLFGPLNFIILDEFLSRIHPNLQSAIKLDRIRIYDFRIQNEEGGISACILRGPLKGAAPLRGDRVLLNANIRKGVYIIQNGWNQTTESVIAPKNKPSIIILAVTIILLCVQVVYLRGFLDEWLYPWFAELWTTFFEAE